MSDPTKKKRTGKYTGVGFRQRSGAVFIDMGAAFSSSKSKKAAPAKAPIDTSSEAGTQGAADIQETTPYDLPTAAPWSIWGSDNLLPLQYVEDIEKCGVLNAIIDGKARFALGQGMIPALVHSDPKTGVRVIDSVVDDPEILDFLEANNHFEHVYGWMRDQVGFSWAVCRYMMDAAGGKITNFQRDDISEIRFEKKDKKGNINRLWYSGRWERIFSQDDPHVFNKPLLKNHNTLEDIARLVKRGKREFALALRNPGWNKHYYPIPLWMAAYKWVKIAQSVPEMKASLFNNSMRPKYKVIIMDDYWNNRYGDEWDTWDEDEQEAKREEFYDEIDEWLVGSENAYKSIFVNGKLVDETGKVITDLDIVPIEDTTKPGELLPDSAAANTEIAIAMLWNNAMTGGNQKDGQYAGNEGGSNVREASLLQTILHEVERHNVQRFMNPIKHINGWHEKFSKNGKRLEFIVPATVLTTLDTGSGSKPVVTGTGAESKSQ